MNKRIEYIDLLKLFAISLVLWGHSIQYMSFDNYYDNPIFEFIYSFHMPLFMMLSGYFFSSSLDATPFTFLKKKTRQLLLPILIWALLYEFFSFSYSLLLHTEVLPITKILVGFKFNINESLWFLKSLFSCYVISYIGLKILKKEWLACVLTILLFLIVHNPFNVRFMLPFFWLGIFIRKYYYLIEKYAKFLFAFSFISFVIMLFFWKGEYTIYVCKAPSLFYLQENFFEYRMTVAIFRFLIGTAGSLSFILFFRYLFEKVKLRTLSNYGKYTQGIYIVHSYFFGVFAPSIIILPIPHFYYNFIITPIAAVILFFVSYYIVRLMERNRYSSFLFLGNELK